MTPSTKAVVKKEQKGTATKVDFNTAINKLSCGICKKYMYANRLIDMDKGLIVCANCSRIKYGISLLDKNKEDVYIFHDGSYFYPYRESDYIDMEPKKENKK